MVTFLIIWLLFSALTYRIADSGISSGSDHNRLVFATTLGTILGPMTGAISREWQGCCLNFSLSLLPYCGAALAVGAIALFVKLPFQRGAEIVRMCLWVAGLCAWFAGGIVSFGHALS